MSSLQVPWPGHLHLSAGSPYFGRRFDQQHAAAKKQYIAMESLRVRLQPYCWHLPVICLVLIEMLFQHIMCTMCSQMSARHQLALIDCSVSWISA